MTKYEKNLELYDKLLAEFPEIDRKGKNMLYTSHNGHMFTYYSKEAELGIRLSKEDKKEFEEKYKTGPFIQYNSVMRGYVSIPQELLEDTKELKRYLELSYAYINTLEPK